MNIMDLAGQYIASTRPSELKRQGINDYIDAMIKIRHYMDISARNKKVAANRVK